MDVGSTEAERVLGSDHAIMNIIGKTQLSPMQFDRQGTNLQQCFGPFTSLCILLAVTSNPR